MLRKNGDGMRKLMMGLAVMVCVGVVGLAVHGVSCAALIKNIPEMVDECKKIEADDERLKCYDSISKMIPQEINKNDGWNIKRGESMIDGKKSVIYAKFSQNTIANSIGRQETALFILRCQNNKTDAFIVWPGYLGHSDSVEVIYKVDNLQPVKEGWNPSSGASSGVFQRNPVDFIVPLWEG